jgi:hypothetical protein
MSHAVEGDSTVEYFSHATMKLADTTSSTFACGTLRATYRQSTE